MGYSIIHAISQILLLFHDFLCSILIRRTARNIGIPTGFNTLILVLRKTYFSQIRVNPPRSPLFVRRDFVLRDFVLWDSVPDSGRHVAIAGRS